MGVAPHGATTRRQARPEPRRAGDLAARRPAPAAWHAGVRLCLLAPPRRSSTRPARAPGSGAALANGTDEVACVPGVDLDAYVIAAVQRVLTGTNGQIPIPQVKEIHIYKAVNVDGSESADLAIVNVWVPGAGPSVEACRSCSTGAARPTGSRAPGTTPPATPIRSASASLRLPLHHAARQPHGDDRHGAAPH